MSAGRDELEALEAEAHAESERAIAHHERPEPMIQTGDGLQTLSELEPETREERLVAAGAVGRYRNQAAALAFWDALGGFERELAHRAFMEGARHLARRLDGVIGTGSATVDAPAIRRVNAGRPPLFTPDVGARVAGEARRYVEASHEAPAALRLAAVERELEGLVELLRAHHVAEDDAPHEPPEGSAEAEAYDLAGLRALVEDLEAGVHRLTIAAAGVELGDQEEAPA